MDTREVSGLEALIRWNHPELGLVGPDRFIPVAEDSGLIIEIGDWVIKEACRQAADWRAMGIPELRIAINISALQLHHRDLEKVISAALSQWHIEPRTLEIEITESALVHNSEDVAALLKLLRGFGIGIALDDFGTGYSNFTYLKHFDLDRLKIDQSFIRHITSNKGDIAIVNSIVQLARNFGLETVAEGVETEEGLEIVRRAGCYHAQGYVFARPLMAENIPEFLANRNRLISAIDVDRQKRRHVRPRTIQ